MAVIIESLEGIPLGRGYCRVPGPASAQNSYRAELFGIYVTLCTVEATVTKYHITEGHIQLHCDNLWSINKSIFAKSRVEGINTHHYDILWALNRLLRKLPISVEFFHVYGHQAESVARHDPICHPLR